MKNDRKPRDLVGQVLNLNHLLDCHEGAVVSRTIISKLSGTVTMFAFDHGQGLSEHTAPFDAMVYVLDGAVKISISDKLFNLKQGEMIIMPANKTHALKAITRLKILLVMVKS